MVITGFGALTNLGLNAATTWDSMKSGKSGISSIEGDEFTSYDREHWDV
ncbi:MAG: beta-ketoacyl synthase N-terminal-like domain-containing protein, partial [Phycisphaerales bacterium]